MNRVAMYLRKSRADMEAEARGEGETLARHKKSLLKLAKDKNLNIIKIRQEIVSGESLVHRPEMMELLKEVGNGKFEAVLVMDMDRLGRGNMQEQGLILETFKNSKTKIITPRKTYDLEDEFDQEYSEFEAFMARKELKIINRRMREGIKRSVMEGNYLGNRPPYGYQIHKDKNIRTLIPDPEQAPVIKLIFEWYTGGETPENRIGSRKIACKLTEWGYKSSTGKPWTSSTVRVILKNEVYTGRIQWNKRDIKKSTDPLYKNTRSPRPREEWIDVKGFHEPLISTDLYKKTQELLEKKQQIPTGKNQITNPLAGLIRCKKCNYRMSRRFSRKTERPSLRCKTVNCICKSSILEVVEERLLISLRDWLSEYKIQFSKSDFENENDPISLKVKLLETSVTNLKQEIKNLETQRGNLHDFLERGIYTEETYLERSTNIVERINQTNDSLDIAVKELELESKRVEAKVRIIPKVEHVLNEYSNADSPAQKNLLLKGVIDYCLYEKEPHQKLDNFTLDVFPKL